MIEDEQHKLPCLPADIKGRWGSAWKFLPNNSGRPDATVAGWIVYAPWAHPLWHSYAVMVVHLRSEDGLPKPVVHLKHATHEILVVALNPDRPIDLGGPLYHLTPLNFAAQFIAPSDALAAGRVESTVREIVDGRLSPDTDFLHEWVLRYGDSNLKGGGNA